jgi:ABC-type bacteriocin/lantibiotic exporter with double-glycine peptidase domain
MTKHWSRVLLAGGCLVISTIFSMIPPLLVQTIFDDVLPRQDTQQLALYAGAVLGLTAPRPVSMIYGMISIKPYSSNPSVFMIKPEPDN